MKILKEEKENGKLTDFYSILYLSYETGILKIEKDELKNFFFYTLENAGKNKNYIFYKKKGKIIKRKLWEKLNV